MNKPKRPLVREVSVNMFNRMAGGSRPLLVKFWSPACSHCATFAPVVQGAAEELAGEVVVVSMCIDEEDKAKVAASYNVNGLPALLLNLDDYACTRIGTDTKRGVVTWVRNELKKHSSGPK